MSKKDDLEPLFGLVDSLNKHKNKLQNKSDTSTPSAPYQISKQGSPFTKLIMRGVIAASVLGVGILIWMMTQIKAPSVQIGNSGPASRDAPTASTATAKNTLTTLGVTTTIPRRSQGFAGRTTAPVQTVPPHMQVREDANDEQRERELREREYDGTQGYEPPPLPVPYDPNQNNNPGDNNISN